MNGQLDSGLVLGRSFKDIFPKRKGANSKYYFDFLWKGKSFRYEFKSLPINGLNSKKLLIDGSGLLVEKELDDLTCDMIALLLFASTSDYAEQAGLTACEIGTMLGDEDALLKFVKQRYIVVSKQTSGATANSLGQLAQTEIVNFLAEELGDKYKIIRNGYLAIEGYDKKGGMPFDLVLKRERKKLVLKLAFKLQPIVQ